jgi:hypothetical protein
LGQFKSKGGIVNVPVDIDTTVASLPRSLDDTRTVHLSLARRLIFKSDYVKSNIAHPLSGLLQFFFQRQELYQEYNIALNTEWMDEAMAKIDNTFDDHDDLNSGGEDAGNDGDEENTREDNSQSSTVGNTDHIEQVARPTSILEESIIVADYEGLRMAPGDGRTLWMWSQRASLPSKYPSSWRS